LCAGAAPKPTKTEASTVLPTSSGDSYTSSPRRSLSCQSSELHFRLSQHRENYYRTPTHV